MLCRLSPAVTRASTGALYAVLLKFCAPPPVTEPVDEWREDEDVENGMCRGSAEARPDAQHETQKGRAQRKADPPP